MKSFTKVILLVALAALPFVAVAPAHAAKKMEVTIQDDSVFLYGASYYSRDAALLQARALGASQLRMNVLWWQTMPAAQATAKRKPRNIDYNWSVWDSAIDRARDYGLKVQLSLAGDPPRWACGRKLVPNECDGLKPNPRAFGQFAKAAAKHFGKRVKRYSIWNEPNWYSWLRPLKKAPLLYRKLYQKGYKGIKKGNKRAKVLMGELAPYAQPKRSMAPLKFLREMTCVNKRFKKTRKAKKKCKGKLKLDGFAHHPYDFDRPPTKRRKGRDNVTMANLGALTKTLNKMRKKRLIKPSVKKVPLFLTEHGYYVKRPETPAGRGLSERKRKKYTVKAFDMAQRNKHVKQMLYYNFVSVPPGHPSAFFDLGLIRTSGEETKPYRGLQKWVRNAVRTKRVKKPGRCRVC